MELFNPTYFAFYVIGLLSASWHLAYGIWLFAAKWGITVGERARKRFLYVCMALFLFISGVGLASITSFRSHKQQPTDPAGAAQIEQSQTK
jgi:succinate dehydrogenase cytochrome b subunit